MNEIIKNKVSKLKEKRGATALLWVMLGFIVVLSFQGHVNISNQQSVVNELQQQMDIAGLNALNRTIDIQQLQLHEDLFNSKLTNEEFLENYGHDIKQAYREELYTSIPVRGAVKDVQIMEGALGDGLKVEFIPAPDDGLVGAEHILLDAVVRVTMESFGNFRETEEETLLFELGSNGSTRLTSIRRNVDGNIDLFLHNQTRLQYK